MKRNMLIVLTILLLLPFAVKVQAVDLMFTGRYDFNAKEGGGEIQVLTGIPLKGSFADHFFLAGGVAVDDKSMDGYEGLLGFRFRDEEAAFNFGLVGGPAAAVLDLINQLLILM